MNEKSHMDFDTNKTCKSCCICLGTWQSDFCSEYCSLIFKSAFAILYYIQITLENETFDYYIQKYMDRKYRDLSSYQKLMRNIPEEIYQQRITWDVAFATLICIMATPRSYHQMIQDELRSIKEQILIISNDIMGDIKMDVVREGVYDATERKNQGYEVSDDNDE